MEPVKQNPTFQPPNIPRDLDLTSINSLEEKNNLILLYQHELHRLELRISELEKTNTALIEEIYRLQGIINRQKQELFGRSSEKDALINNNQIESAAPEPHGDNQPGSSIKPKRGAKPGHQGHGRKIPNISEIEVIHKIPTDDQYCPRCGKPMADTGLTEDSYEIDCEFKLVRLKHVRKRAVRTCDCPGPKFAIAPKPANIIPKGKYTHAFLAYILTMKFVFQIPLHRLVSMISFQGVKLSESSLYNPFRTLDELLQPLYDRLIEVSRQSNHWHIDETGWAMFVDGRHNWWLWIFVSPQTVVYVLDASRSSQVPYTHLGDSAQGIVSSDRHASYAKLIRLIAGLVNAQCWVHFRRDFIDFGKGYPSLASWAQAWVERIANIYRLNEQRLAQPKDSPGFDLAQAALEKGLDEFKQQMNLELESTSLNGSQRHILRQGSKRWENLTVFVDHPEIPMDNNTAERCLRPAALGRKNYYGNHATWSGHFTAIGMSLFQTAIRHGLNPQAYLQYVLDLIARSQTTPDWDCLLPWNIPEKIRHTYHMSQGETRCRNKVSAPLFVADG
jgi:transposase